MPTTVTRSTTVDAPRDAVAATLADFAALADWSRAVDHVSALTYPAAGLGAARRVQVGRRVVVEQVVDWDPPRTIAYRIEGLPARAGEVVNRWTLATPPNGDGGTAVTLATTVDAGPRPPARLVERVLATALARTSDRLLADLAALHAAAPVRSAR